MLRPLLALVMGFWLATSSAEIPSGFEASYRISSGMLGGGSATLHFEQADGRYRLHSSTRASGLLGLIYRSRLDEYSRGWIGEDGELRPEQYLYLREGRGARRAELRFDWEREQVVNDVGGPVWRLAIPEGTTDRLLMQVAVMRDLARGKERMEYQVADGGELRRITLQVDGEQELDTPAGRFRAVRLRHDESQDSGKTSRTTFWCAPELGYLPVRLEHQDPDGRDYVMVLTAYERPHTVD
ncbi:MAG: DUF3108 domain-containing protein [Ectothiorhodospiraceae bacterium]|nr:DUF3108 domain-containing protein [Ectothiorhodospiraceae bacterium]MCH8505611.1 DUF3108 domain-containing protein [Ectothiorhodospiraceae bacterium]